LLGFNKHELPFVPMRKELLVRFQVKLLRVATFSIHYLLSNVNEIAYLLQMTATINDNKDIDIISEEYS